MLKHRLALGIAVAALTASGSVAAAQSSSDTLGQPWPRCVLVTNDNGIDDRATLALAVALGRIADTYLVASVEDRSGYSNLLTVTQTGTFGVQRRNVGAGVRAWAIHGTPADAVIFALSGPMRDDPPDLVISGINGGSNLADDWFGSGTIGAVRTGAYFGVPGIAISGVEDDDSTSVNAVVAWVVELARSELARKLEAPQYLTVSLPELPPDRIKGPRIVRRARGLVTAVATPDSLSGTDSLEIWEVRLETHPDSAAPETDVAAVAAGHIAIVPIRVDEYDGVLAEKLSGELAGSAPPWPPELSRPRKERSEQPR
ncbi:MAG TPA: 5'/3'-nucleotidase SurE [Gemmatimonadaceae bacterium]|nr:5'/3'-nucleotidase SurE [Gemmatimonadaceae bacterium]